jgi:plasmid stabilization system protein ParE
MDREVVWSLLATADLESIVEHIFRDSEFYAAAVARELVAAARSLATFSERGRVVPEYEDSAVREIIVRRYRLILSGAVRPRGSAAHHSWCSATASNRLRECLTIRLQAGADYSGSFSLVCWVLCGAAEPKR